MKIVSRFISVLLALCCTLVSADDKPVHVVFETTLGNIVIEVEEVKVPKASAYFLGFVDRGDYNGSSFYRSGSLDSGADIQLIQGGLLSDSITQMEPSSFADAGLVSLPIFETSQETGLKHEYAAISLARDLLDTGDAIPEFAIYLRDGPESDFNGRTKPDSRGFPVFGKVVEGMSTVKKISKQDLAGVSFVSFLKGQILTEPVVITKAYRK